MGYSVRGSHRGRLANPGLDKPSPRTHQPALFRPRYGNPIGTERFPGLPWLGSTGQKSCRGGEVAGTEEGAGRERGREGGKGKRHSTKKKKERCVCFWFVFDYSFLFGFTAFDRAKGGEDPTLLVKLCWKTKKQKTKGTREQKNETHSIKSKIRMSISSLGCVCYDF